MFAGIAAIIHGETIEIGLAANDANYSIDSTFRSLNVAGKSPEQRSKMVVDFVLATMQSYQAEHLW